MVKIIALIVLLITVIGLAHTIEVTARPDSGKRGVRVEGHDH